jgi:hypothetical protein
MSQSGDPLRIVTHALAGYRSFGLLIGDRRVGHTNRCNWGPLTQTATISDPAATAFTLEGLASGTWYFAICAFTSGGAASAISSVVKQDCSAGTLGEIRNTRMTGHKLGP